MSVPETSLQPADADLVQRARKGDQLAFRDLVHRHYERTFRLVYAVIRHEADARDVTQEVWLTVWRQLPNFRGDAQFTTWLHPIATRRALDHLRRRRRWFERFLPFNLSDETNPAMAVDSSAGTSSTTAGEPEHILRVRQALDYLPPKHRAVLALREMEGLSYEDIAAAMKIPAGTVMSRIYHARRLLAKKLGAKL